MKAKQELNIMVTEKMHDIKPINEKQKLNIMVTEIMLFFVGGGVRRQREQELSP